MSAPKRRQRSVMVIVPTYEEPRLSQCLDALDVVEAPPATRVDVLVIDNGSAKPPTDVVAAHQNARLLIEHRRGSYAARNMGIAASDAEVLAFTDADCMPTAGWLTTALARLDSDSTVAAVAGRVQLVFSGAGPSSPCDWWEALEAFPQEMYVASGFGVTANLVVRADVVHAVGGFDVNAVSGGDVDFGSRLSKGGHRLIYEADAVVLHPARSSWSELLGKARRTARGRSRFEQLQGRDFRGFRRSIRWQVRELRRTLKRGLTDPGLPGARARVGYLCAGMAFRLVLIGVSVASEGRYRSRKQSVPR